MKGDNTLYLFISKNQELGLTTASPVKTSGGANEHFSKMGVDHYWEVGLDEPSAYIKAIAEALQAGAKPGSVYSLVERMTATKHVIEAFLKKEGLGVIYEDGYAIVTNGEKEVRGSDITTAFFNWYSPEPETKNKDSNEDEIKNNKEEDKE